MPYIVDRTAEYEGRQMFIIGARNVLSPDSQPKSVTSDLKAQLQAKHTPPPKSARELEAERQYEAYLKETGQTREENEAAAQRDLEEFYRRNFPSGRMEPSS